MMLETTLESAIVTKIEAMERAELETLTGTMMRDPLFGCWTRQGLELVVWPEVRERARWVIIADMNNLHAINESLGYAEANRRIREAIQLRKSDIPSVGRWQEGDEILWILCEEDERGEIDPQGAAKRLQEAFHQFGLSATFGIARVMSYDLQENVQPASDLMQRAKNRGKRGTINQTGKLVWRLW